MGTTLRQSAFGCWCGRGQRDWLMARKMGTGASFELNDDDDDGDAQAWPRTYKINGGITPRALATRRDLPNLPRELGCHEAKAYM